MTEDNIINRLSAEALHQVTTEGMRFVIQMAVAAGYTLGQQKYANNKEVVQMTKDDREIRTFPSQKEAERGTDIHQCDISDCCKGYSYRKFAGGYKWKFANAS